MPILQYETRVSPEGFISHPLPSEFHDCKVVVRLEEKKDEDQLREERIAAELTRINDRTPEEREAAFDKFMAAWRGCLKGVPHMTAKEILAERLEKKYGEKDD